MDSNKTVMTNDGPINVSVLAETLPELEALWQQFEDAKLMYSAAIDAVSEKTHVTRRVLRQLVNAIKADKVQQCSDDAQNLADLLEVLAND